MPGQRLSQGSPSFVSGQSIIRPVVDSSVNEMKPLLWLFSTFVLPVIGQGSTACDATWVYRLYIVYVYIIPRFSYISHWRCFGVPTGELGCTIAQIVTTGSARQSEKSMKLHFMYMEYVHVVLWLFSIFMITFLGFGCLNWQPITIGPLVIGRKYTFNPLKLMLQFKAKSVLTCSQWVSCLHYLEVGARQMICTQGLNI